MNVIGYMTVEQPGSWFAGHHFHSLENTGEELKDICAVHPVRLNKEKEPIKGTRNQR